MPRTLGAYTGTWLVSPLPPLCAIICALGFGLTLTACSVDIPLPGFAAPETTASIDTDASRLSPGLTAQDWALAKVALKAALEAPAGEVSPLHAAAWGNPTSGMHGTFARDPDPKAQWLAAGGDRQASACQYFIASVEGATPAEREGLACRDANGAWSVRQTRERASKS